MARKDEEIRAFQGALNPPPHGAGWLQLRHSPFPALLPLAHWAHTAPATPCQSRGDSQGERYGGTDLAVTLARDRVTHAGLSASLVAVTAPALGVVVVARGTEVTLPPDDVGLAPGWTQEPEELSELSSPPLCTSPPFSLPRCPITPAGTGVLPGVPSARTRLPHLHCPLSTSQPGSVSSCTPGREQLQSSQPMRGWQPKVWGSQTTHSGFRVWGGQMHCPVTSSHRRVPQSQAARGRTKLGLGEPRKPRRAWGMDTERAGRQMGEENSRLQLGKPQ